MSGASGADAGVMSGLVNTTQQAGAALGVAVLSALAAGRSGHLMAAGATAGAALTQGYRLAFGVGAGLTVAALLIAIAALRPGAGRPASAVTATEAEARTVPL
jgi:hypothetical protein